MVEEEQPTSTAKHRGKKDILRKWPGDTIVVKNQDGKGSKGRKHGYNSRHKKLQMHLSSILGFFTDSVRTSFLKCAEMKLRG